MTVLLVLGMFGTFLTIDFIRSRKAQPKLSGTIRLSVPGYEQLGACACDGGEPLHK